MGCANQVVKPSTYGQTGSVLFAFPRTFSPIFILQEAFYEQTKTLRCLPSLFCTLNSLNPRKTSKICLSDQLRCEEDRCDSQKSRFAELLGETNEIYALPLTVFTVRLERCRECLKTKCGKRTNKSHKQSATL